jgi:tRNA-modifying protein YgfZ
MPGTTLHERALIRLSGEDVRGFLQGLVTQDVRAVTPEAPLWAGLLSPQGKALFDFILWAEGDDILIDCERGQAEALARRLTMYRLRRPIAIAREPELCVHWAPDGEQGVPDPRLPELGRRWLAPAGEGESADAAWTAHRFALGVPEGVADLGQDTTLWLEANAAELNGVNFAKGCYVGQENTARMNWRQKVNRRLVRVDGPEGAKFERRRVEALGDDAFVPGWLQAALA